MAEYDGAIVMILLMTVSLRLFVSPQLEGHARENTREADGGHHHHAASEPLASVETDPRHAPEPPAGRGR